jgi:hypothetical protein
VAESPVRARTALACLDRFDFSFDRHSHSGHTGREIAWNEGKVAMIKEVAAS